MGKRTKKKRCCAVAKKAKRPGAVDKKRGKARAGRAKAAPGKKKAARRDVKIKSPEDRLFWKLAAVVLIAFSAFAAVSLASFDWQSVAALCENPSPTENLMGVAGNMFAYAGYKMFGLAIWFLPLAMFLGGLKMFEPIPDDVDEIPNRNVAFRICGWALAAVVVSGMFQLAGKWSWVRDVLDGLHIGGNAGGIVGKLFMTSGLEAAVAPFGAFFISLMLLSVAFCMALGLKTVRKLFSWRMPDFGWVEEAADEAGEQVERLGKSVKRKIEETAAPAPVVRTERRKPAKPRFPADAKLPPVDLLDPPMQHAESGNDVAAMGGELMKKLKEFGVVATLAYTVEGPTVTQFAIKPGHGVRVDKIKSLARDLQLTLKAKSLRVFAPIPGEEAVGIQVSNPNPRPVMFREVVESETWQRVATWPKGGRPEYALPLLLGKDVAGEPVVADLSKMPHLLVAGASGKGKSVCLNSMINGLLMSRTPEQLRFILVDPKRTEFSSYGEMPHLLVPVVVDVRKVLGALGWAVREMERRLVVFAASGSRDIIEHNETAETKVPYIVIVIDEVADIMTLCGREVEPVLGRLMALARATGIHLILATQRPDAKTISGTIKANIPGRVALATTNATDSRTILDEGGAEVLIGKGDMLYKSDDGLVRTQGAWVSKGEMKRIMDFMVNEWPQGIDEEVVADMEYEGTGGETGGEPEADGINEEEYAMAKQIVIDANRASISMLQQRMRVGYNHASRIIDLLEKRGVIGPRRGAGPREVLG